MRFAGIIGINFSTLSLFLLFEEFFVLKFKKYGQWFYEDDNRDFAFDNDLSVEKLEEDFEKFKLEKNKELKVNKKQEKETIKNNEIKDAIFINCKMDNLTGTDGSLKNNNFNYSQLLNVTFNNSDLENSTFNGSKLDVEFNNANLDGCQFTPVQLQFHDGRQVVIPTRFDNMVTFDGASMAGATFQETVGLEGKNFNNINLVGASFHGCSLLNTSFRNAYLRNAIFNMCAITGCDFTGARIDGIDVSPDTLATGDENNGLNNRLRPTDRPKIYPSDVHAAFAIVDLNKLYDLLFVLGSYKNYTNRQTLDSMSHDIKSIINKNIEV